MSDYFDHYANTNGQPGAYDTNCRDDDPQANWFHNGSWSSWQYLDGSSGNEQGQPQATHTANTSYLGQHSSVPIALPNFANSLGSGPSGRTPVSSSSGFHPQDTTTTPFPQSEDGQSAYASHHGAALHPYYNSTIGPPTTHTHGGHTVAYSPYSISSVSGGATSFSHMASHMGSRFDTEQVNQVQQQHHHHQNIHYEDGDSDSEMESSMTSNATAIPVNLQHAHNPPGQQLFGQDDPNAGPLAQRPQFASNFPIGHQCMQFGRQLTETELQQHNAADAHAQASVSGDADPWTKSSAAAEARQLLASGDLDDSFFDIEEDEDHHASDSASSDGTPAPSDKQKGKKAKGPKAPSCACEWIKSTSEKAFKQASKKAKKNADEGKITEDRRPKFQQPPSQYSEITFIKQRGTSWLCSECGETLGSDKAKERHVLLQHWTMSMIVCFICSGFFVYDPPGPLGAPIDYKEQTGPPWKCRLCNDDGPSSFHHTWEQLGHMQREHYYPMSSSNMYMIRRGEEVASAHFCEFADPGHELCRAWLKKKCGHFFTVRDDAFDILRFCPIHGGPVTGLAQLGKCRVQQEHDRSTMITSLTAGYTKAVLQYMRLPQITAYFKRAARHRWGEWYVGREHLLRWSWNGQQPSRLLRALEMLSFHTNECVSRQRPPGKCDGCPHPDAIEPSELAMLVVDLAQVEQRPLARPMPEEMMPAPKRKGPSKKGKQPLR